MKTVKELLAEKAPTLSKFDKAVPQGYPDPQQVPSVIMLKRKAIRVFPDNQKIALYYSDALDKYISIPFGPEGKALGIQISEEAPTDDQLNEFLPVVLAGAARIAAPVAARALAAGGRAVAGGAQKVLSLGKRALDSYKARQAAGAASKKAGGKWTRAMRGGGKRGIMRRVGAGIATAAGNAADAAGPSGGDNRQTTDFNFGSKALVQEPVSSVSRANNVSREKQNQNQIWNTNTPVNRRVDESKFEIIKRIVESNTRETIDFGGELVVVTPRIAKKLVNVHESLNKKNQKNFEGMLDESLASLQKAINFAIRT
jgi:hypothetical protein